MQRPSTKSAAAVVTSSPSRWNSPRVRAIVSVLVLLHLLAVVTGPFNLGPTSKLWASVRGWFRPYLEACFLDHGYRFFDDAGPSHLLRCELEYADGRKETKQFPDRAEHWPRLWYHRHFMLSEHLNNMGVVEARQRPADIKLTSEQEAAWQFDKERADAYLRSYADHLLHMYGAERVSLFALERIRPSMSDVTERKLRLDDPRFMSPPFSLGTFVREQP